MDKSKREEQDQKDGSPSLIDKDFLSVRFQCGPVKENGVNGCQVVDVLEVAYNRLKGFQDGPFKSREGALCLTKIEEAIMWDKRRTELRVARGVEGENKA